MSRRMWITMMSLVILGVGSGTAGAQPMDEGCYELGSKCTNGRQCCSGICERDSEETSITDTSYCTNGL